jgi:hypothetical protein
MKKSDAKAAVGKIWALVYRSSQITLSPQQEDELESAITDLGKSIDGDDLADRRASFVCECAHMHLAALRAIPPRKPHGTEGLVQDCERLSKLLDQ